MVVPGVYFRSWDEVGSKYLYNSARGIMSSSTKNEGSLQTTTFTDLLLNVLTPGVPLTFVKFQKTKRENSILLQNVWGGLTLLKVEKTTRENFDFVHIFLPTSFFVKHNPQLYSVCKFIHAKRLLCYWRAFYGLELSESSRLVSYGHKTVSIYATLIIWTLGFWVLTRGMSGAAQIVRPCTLTRHVLQDATSLLVDMIFLSQVETCEHWTFPKDDNCNSRQNDTENTSQTYRKGHSLGLCNNETLNFNWFNPINCSVEVL